MSTGRSARLVRRGKVSGLGGSARVADDLEIHPERLIHGSRTRVGRREPAPVLARGCPHERVVDGTTRDGEASDLGAKNDGLRFAEEGGRREVVRQQADRVGR